MNLELNEQQRLLQESLAKFLQAQSAPKDVRAAEPVGFSPPLWRGLVELGIPLMRASADAGGADAGLIDAAIVAEEAGRHLAPAPINEVMVAARILGALGSPENLALLRRMGDGEAIVTLALRACAPGTPQIVPAGAVADAVICLEGDELALVERGQAVRRNETGDMNTNPGGLPVERWALSQKDAAGPRRVLARGAQARALYEGAVEEWRILRAAALGGAARRAVEMAAAYACERQQFGRPIGSFQAIAHPLADSITDIEGARLLVWRAIWANARGEANASAAAAMAAWWASEASRIAVRRALRTFGGYGLSLEYDVQLYFRRVNALALLDGDPLRDLEGVGERLWGGAAATQPPAGAMELELGFGGAAEKFAAEARKFFEKNLTPELRAKAHHSCAGHDAGFHRLLVKAGLAYPDWPKPWGQARGAFEVAALARVFEDFRWTRTPIGITNIGARMVMQFGSPELQREVLPRLAAGDALSCLGFTEAGSGSDMFAAKTRAIRDGSDWIINGHKMFTTGAEIADYVLLLTRSDPAATKHRGLTIFFVPLTLPGVEVRPLQTMQDERTNITHYTDVRVPDRYRLGDVDQGLKVMAAAMALEHGGDGYHILQLSLLDAAVTWAKKPGAGDKRPMDDPAVRARLARVAVHTEVADLLCRRAIWAGVNGHGDRTTGPMSKMFATETYMKDASDLMALAAPETILPAGAALAEIEMKHRQSIGNTIYGGTSEVHRGIIAENALRLPRAG